MISDQTADIAPQHTFTWTAPDGPSHQVVTAVASELNTEPTELEPLHDTVDADALNSIFTRTEPAHGPVNGRIRFDYMGYRVVIEARGTGFLYETDDDDDGPTTTGT